MVEGELAVYVERGGKTLLTFSENPDVLAPAMTALAKRSTEAPPAATRSRSAICLTPGPRSASYLR